MTELTHSPVPPTSSESKPNASLSSGRLSPFSIQIGRLYEGPFDLLLDLIRRQDINVYDIPIAEITAQYLHYLESLRELDVEVAAEFLMVAATLIQIKSKMLLPADPLLPGETPEDPREELVHKLLEYEKFKQAAGMLQQRQQLEAASWSHAGQWEFADEVDAEGQLAVGVYDLITTLQHMLRRLAERPRLELIRDEVTVQEMMDQIYQSLAASVEPLAVREVFQLARSRGALLATFLAVLELVRVNVAMMRQDRAFGEIFLKRHRRFHEAWAAMRALSETPGVANE